MLNVTTISFFIRYHRIAAERLPQVWQTSNLKIRTLLPLCSLFVHTYWGHTINGLQTWQHGSVSISPKNIHSFHPLSLPFQNIRFLMYKRVLIMCAALTENVIHGITSKMMQSYHFLRIFRTWKGCTYILM